MRVCLNRVPSGGRYPVDAECWGGLPLVFSYVVATLLVNTLVQKVVDEAE